MLKQLLGGPLTGGPHGLRSPPRSGSHPRLRTNGSGTSATTRPAGGHGTNHPCRVWATRRHHTDRARLHGQRQPAANASSITPRFPTTPRGSIHRASGRQSPRQHRRSTLVSSPRHRTSLARSCSPKRAASLPRMRPRFWFSIVPSESHGVATRVSLAILRSISTCPCGEAIPPRRASSCSSSAHIRCHRSPIPRDHA